MSWTIESIAEALERFIAHEFRIPASDHSFHRDAHLYESGFVDSVGVVELIAFLESTFDVKLEDEDLFGDAFTTINGISAVVCQRLTRMATRPVPAGEHIRLQNRTVLP